MKIEFDPVEAVLEDIRQGKLVIVTDDENRENEGDLVCAAEKVTPQIINFMITHARGLVCAPITEARAKELNIWRAPSTDHFKTAFTESVDALSGTTGISAYDRANTIHALIDPKCKREDFGIPGHIFPIAARPGGVSIRSPRRTPIPNGIRTSRCPPIAAKFSVSTQTIKLFRCVMTL